MTDRTFPFALSFALSPAHPSPAQLPTNLVRGGVWVPDSKQHLPSVCGLCVRPASRYLLWNQVLYLSFRGIGGLA